MLVRQSKSPLWEVLAPKLPEVFPEHDTEGNFVVPALDVRAQVLNVCDTNKGSMSLLLVCASLIFLMMC